jgi:hypothetical protein
MTCFNVWNNPFSMHDFIPTQLPRKKLRIHIGMKEKNGYTGRIRLGWLKWMTAMPVIHGIFGWLDPVIENADATTLTEVGIIRTEGGGK